MAKLDKYNKWLIIIQNCLDELKVAQDTSFCKISKDVCCPDNCIKLKIINGIQNQQTETLAKIRLQAEDSIK